MTRALAHGIMTEAFVKVSTSLRDRLKELNDTELRLLFALGLRINEERECWPTLNVLAEECYRSERQIQRAITRLLAKNFIWVGRRAGGRGRPNIYTLNGYFTYGSQPIQLMAPFMALPEEKGDMGVTLQKGDNPEKGDMGVTLQKGDAPQEAEIGTRKRNKGDTAARKNQKGDIPIVAALQKGDIPIVAALPPLTTPIRRTNKIEEEEEGDAPSTRGRANARPSPRPKPQGDPRIRQVALALEQERGYQSPNYGGEAKAIKWMLGQGYSLEDILACWRAMKRDPYWASRELLLMSVRREIGYWVKMGRKPDAFEKKGGYGQSGRHPQEVWQGRAGRVATAEEFEREARARAGRVGTRMTAGGSQEEQDLQAEMRALMVRASGLPLETKETLRLSTLKPRRGVKGLRAAVEGARAILRRELAWLTLCGTVGLGKTHIAVAIGWEWLEQGRACRYAQVSRLLERLRRTYDLTPEQAFEQREPRFETVFGWYCDTPLLILDDLGAEKLTDWAVSQLDALVDHRYIRGLPLVVTTNILMSELPPRIASRLQDRRLGRVVAVSGPDYRTSGQ